MKTILYILLSVTLFLYSCNNNENDDPNSDDTVSILIDKHQAIIDTTQLIIEGNNIWVRDKPVTGEVVLKLNTGDVCKILEKGEKVQVKDMLDRWYKIEYDGTVGWVFGSQTNLKTEEKIDIMDFSEYLSEFIAAFNDKTVDLNYFQHELIGSSLLYKNGLYCVQGSFELIKRELANPVPTENSFDKIPVGDICSGYPGLKDGFYYQKASSNELPEYTEDAETFVNIEIPEKYKNNELKKVIVITEEYHFAFLYFINVGNMWYLICQDFCDCSA